MYNVVLSPIDPEKLISDISERVTSNIIKEWKPKQPDEYLTRKEVAKLFSVDISTIHNWCKSKKLQPYGIGSRVYFKRSDIEQSLKPLNAGK